MSDIFTYIGLVYMVNVGQFAYIIESLGMFGKKKPASNVYKKHWPQIVVNETWALQKTNKQPDGSFSRPVAGTLNYPPVD